MVERAGWVCAPLGKGGPWCQTVNVWQTEERAVAVPCQVGDRAFRQAHLVTYF